MLFPPCVGFRVEITTSQSTSLATPSPSEDGAEEGQSQEWGFGGASMGASLGGAPALTHGASALIKMLKSSTIAAFNYYTNILYIQSSSTRPVHTPRAGLSTPCSPPHNLQPAADPFGSPGSPVLLPAAGFGGGFGREGSPDLMSAAAHEVNMLRHSLFGLLPTLQDPVLAWLQNSLTVHRIASYCTLPPFHYC